MYVCSVCLLACSSAWQAVGHSIKHVRNCYHLLVIIGITRSSHCRCSPGISLGLWSYMPTRLVACMSLHLVYLHIITLCVSSHRQIAISTGWIVLWLLVHYCPTQHEVKTHASYRTTHRYRYSVCACTHALGLSMAAQPQ
ncbi:hypothetical protein COO60DRAFT_754087 [Scenedesmus sp. NREL 46B-D3]|nr:hypothetical protein COO60DRAFT_754087 [Scenedesmus sp. NREL 46B-D3]